MFVVATIATALGPSLARAQLITSDPGLYILYEQGVAQTSGAIRGMGTIQASIAESQDQHATERDIQGDRVAAARTFQYSTPLCIAASAEGIAGLGRASMANDVSTRSTSAARETAGASRVATGIAAALNWFTSRRSLFGDANDPAVQQAGQRPFGDRQPGAVLSKLTLSDDLDVTQAKAVVKNLTMPYAVPALTRADIEGSPDGALRYQTRGGLETVVNLAQDAANDIMVDRKKGRFDNGWYNQMATQAGLPSAQGAVSQDDIDWMADVGRFSGKGAEVYTQYVSRLSETALLKELVLLQTRELAQGNEMIRRIGMLEMLLVPIASREASEKMLGFQPTASQLPTRAK